jgi:betaine-homocysteine S-methyltransferase
MEREGAQVVGLNCSRGPSTMLPLLQEIRQTVSCYVAAQPVPYRTTPEQFAFQGLKEPGHLERSFPVALEPFLCTRFEMADFAAQAHQLGVNYIGICCGGARTTCAPWPRRLAAPPAAATPASTCTP